MLMLTTLFAICAVGVAFLLRILFALESDLRAQGRYPTRVERIRPHLVQVRSVGRDGAPVIVLVPSNLARRGTAAAGVRANQNSQIKEA